MIAHTYGKGLLQRDWPLAEHGCIVADPPWMERGGGKIKRGADRHYALMKTQNIANLPVQLCSKPDAHLWLWCTNNFLEDGLFVMKAWGFRYVSNVAWVKGQYGDNDFGRRTLKLQQGLGQYIRGSHELCLFGVKGKPPYRTIDGKRAQTPSVIIAPRQEHSRKPDALLEAAERVSAGPYLELFRRGQARPGWTAWGLEVET